MKSRSLISRNNINFNLDGRVMLKIGYAKEREKKEDWLCLQNKAHWGKRYEVNLHFLLF